ncbi:hypothetical protein V1289_002608 [Bradyrhizobium sp. AZCC 2289]|jgi:hypothetical protein
MNFFNYLLNFGQHDAPMRVMTATMVALLILNFVDEHFNGAQYSRGAMAVIAHIARSFG